MKEIKVEQTQEDNTVTFKISASLNVDIYLNGKKVYGKEFEKKDGSANKIFVHTNGVPDLTRDRVSLPESGSGCRCD